MSVVVVFVIALVVAPVVAPVVAIGFTRRVMSGGADATGDGCTELECVALATSPSSASSSMTLGNPSDASLLPTRIERGAEG